MSRYTFFEGREPEKVSGTFYNTDWLPPNELALKLDGRQKLEHEIAALEMEWHFR